ncbi:MULTISPECIES: LCP family protein [unclassified Streptomyces]|uniref:LCP family protein n=1 Tax=unclassified Streptomyces TaxID=2593676 RepID=UPI002E29A6D9|nr:LCP family protein [Streptomyces sp. NBC_01429]
MAGSRQDTASARRGDAGRADARRANARSAASRRRKKRGGKLRLTLAITLSLLVLAASGAGWVYFKLSGNIETFSADGLSDNRPEATTKGQNVLVIGSDARTEGNSALGGGDKEDVGRSDTAFLLHVYADGKHAVAVSVPRDTLLDIPPCQLPDGSWTKEQTNAMFNAAFSVGQTAKGNPACTQNTIEKLTGLRVDHTIVVDFKGFARMTEVVGGVRVCLPTDLYQRDLNPNRATKGDLIFKQGVQKVSGAKALDYVRIRHGIGDGSDIGRIKRQQAFVGSLIKQVKDDGLTPTKLLPLANAATESMTVDPELGTADKLISFMMGLKSIDLHNTKFITIPWRYQGARVAIVEPDASQLWAALKADRTVDGTDASGKGKKSKSSTEPSPSQSTSPKVSGDGVAVAVYNGTEVTGLAARGGRILMDHGFTLTGTATASTQDYDATVIEYGPGEDTQAKTTARLFPGAKLQQATAPGINVIVGSAFANDPTAGPAAAEPDPSESASVPSAVADDARSADDDPCSNLSYG